MGTGALGWEYLDGSMGMGAWGQERKNESMRTGAWGWQLAYSSVMTCREGLGPFFPYDFEFLLTIYLFLFSSFTEKNSK